MLAEVEAFCAEHSEVEEALQGLQAEEAALEDIRRKQARNADEPTSEMYHECQELLQMFGIPYHRPLRGGVPVRVPAGVPGKN